MIARSLKLRPLAIVFGVALLSAAPVRAQDASLATASGSTVAAAPAIEPAPAGPMLTTASVAVRRPAAEAKAGPAAAAAGGHERGTVLMIVGGAAILTGLVIGNGAGYAISVGGAVIGLYGLYQYLQ